ncbi:hypothetical protein [Halosegnis longus]|uniref:Uncharacterized protein n=1 Tax=Halosegnis longus TaxID=2216012 RepID=A0AAJ4R8X2_9EURY|nr:hypothetical protein [Halosegnis longus]RNJ26504.1 hypothetical protein Nmn1133_07350 [Salella cibi]
MRTRRLPTLLLVVCLALTGCTVGYSGPTATPAPETTPTPDPDARTATPTPETDSRSETPTSYDSGGIEVTGGRLEFNAGQVYDRMARLLDTSAQGPERIRIRTLGGQSTSPMSVNDSGSFYDLFGLSSSDSDAGGTVAAYVARPSTVNVNAAILGDSRVESILAHEYVHTVQFRENAIGAVRGATDYTLDGRLASNGAIEGAAVFGANAYWEQYIETGVSPADDAARLYRNSTGRGRLTAAAYALGYEHVAARIDDPARLGAVYQRPPTTTEQLLHPGVREGPRELTAEVGETEWLASASNQRFGELFVRTALGTAVNESAATRAAAGWGSDTRLDFVTPAGNRGYAWVLRFDDSANASEFEAVARAWLDERATREDAGWTSDRGDYRLTSVGTETVVWLAGVEPFVEEATVESDGVVTVSV